MAIAKEELLKEYRRQQEYKAQRAEIPIELRKKIRSMSDEEIKKEYGKISYGIRCWLEDSLFRGGVVENLPASISDEKIVYLFTASTKWGKFYHLNKQIKTNPEKLVKCKGKRESIEHLYEKSCVEVLIIEEYYKRLLKPAIHSNNR